MSATTVEVAHEALFREWPRLRSWLEEDAQGRRTHARLTDAAREWDAAGRDPSDVYRGARLAVALEWRDGHDGQISHIERAFLDTSRAAADRAQRRLRLALAGVAALLALAVAGGLAALHQGGTARAAARAAEAQQISAQALTDGALERSLLMARQGVALDDSPMTRGNLLAALLRYPAAIAVVHPRGNPLRAIDISPNGRTLAVGDRNGTLELIDARTRRAIAPPRRVATTISQVRFSPDGATAYTAGGDGSVVAWDLTGTRWLGRPFRIRPRTPSGLAPLTPTGPAVAVADDHGDVDLLDGRTLMRAARIAVMPAGRSSRRQSMRIAIAPDGHTIATGTADGEVRFASVRTGRPLGPPRRAHIGAVLALAFSPDGAWLATSGGDRAIYIWDVRHQTPRGLISLPGAPASSLSVSPDGTTLAATTHDANGAGELDSIAIPRLALLANVPVPPGAQTQFSRDGRLLFYGDDTGRIWMRDTRTWKPRGGPLGGSSGTGRFALTPDDHLLATTSTDGTTQLWDVRSGRPIGTALPGVAGQPVSAAFIQGGADLVTIDRHGRGDAWDLRPTSWERRACNIAGRTLTPAEWHEALPERPYSPACPG
jgi:WD40 repeat protein